MDHPPIGRGEAAGLPITITDFIAASRPGLPLPRVQVRKNFREGPIVLCAEVLEVHDNDGQWFRVETQIGALWVEGRNVRMCSGHGLCTCDPVTAAERKAC